MKKDHTQSDSISHTALRLLVRLSGIKQVILAERFGISEEYLSKILNDKRKGKLMRIKIYNYLTQVNTLTEKIAAWSQTGQKGWIKSRYFISWAE